MGGGGTPPPPPRGGLAACGGCIGRSRPALAHLRPAAHIAPQAEFSLVKAQKDWDKRIAEDKKWELERKERSARDAKDEEVEVIAETSPDGCVTRFHQTQPQKGWISWYRQLRRTCCCQGPAYRATWVRRGGAKAALGWLGPHHGDTAPR